MALKRFIKKHYIEIIIVIILLFLIYGGFFIESQSQYAWGDYINRSGEAVLKFFLSIK